MARSLPIRRISQIVVVVLIFVLAFLHQKYGIEKAAPIHAFCPFGAIETFFTHVFSGIFIQKIYWSNYILLGLFIVLTIFFGRVFCGFFCPFGAISEWLRILGKKIGIKKDIELPVKWDHYLRYIKYGVLILIVYLSFRYAALVFDSYDPFSALMHMGNELEELKWGYIILGFVVLTSLFSKGRRCRYFCPLGAFFALLKKISFFKLAKDKDSCTKCGLCNKSCPMNLNLKDYKEYNSSECISCLECVDSCPQNSLYVSIFGKQIKKSDFLWMVVGTFFVALGLIVLTPYWKTKPISNIINEQGIVEVANIKGSNTLQYVIEKTHIPFEYFQEKLHLPSDIEKTMKLKEIGTTYNLKNMSGEILETEDIRTAILQYKK